MIQLGLDTSLGACSAALYDSATQTVIASEMQVMERGHAEALGPMVERVFAAARLAPRDLGRVVVTRGPGTFTGLRIALSFAKGLALARGLPLRGIDTLWATAAPSFGGSHAFVIAHKAGATGKYYVGCFDGADGRQLRDHALLSPDAVTLLVAELGQTRLIGSGLEDHSNTWPDAAKFISAAAMLADDPTSATPLYLRAPDAKPIPLQGKTTPALRLASAADVEVLSALHMQCFEKGWTAAMLRNACASPSATTLIMENAGVACGFTQAQAVAGEAEILTLCVLPMLRRHGLAHLLLGGLIADLKMRGIKKLFLEVASRNDAAMGLYVRAGFHEIGRRRAYYANGDDALTMALVL
jgi:tRNA threonylcarbamoyl adenosine modification protein YeaZ/ribosomal-protein-alanine acetyltransferase